MLVKGLWIFYTDLEMIPTATNIIFMGKNRESDGCTLNI